MSVNSEERMYEILGIDNGNEVAKTNAEIKFFNRMKVGATRLNKDDIVVNYGGLKYTLGIENATANVGTDKHLAKQYKISLLTSIALSVPNKDNIKAKIVVGTPVQDYNDEEHTKSIKNTIMSWGKSNITVNGIDKEIEILDCEVFPESGIPFSDKAKYKNLRTLVVDLGGSTVDVSLWNGLRLENFKTYKEGMLTLYSNIIKIINEANSSKLDDTEAKHMIGKENYNINQKSVKVKETVDSIIDTYLTGILSSVYQDFDRDKVDIVEVIGGGAMLLKEYIEPKFKSSKISNKADFANANTFEKVAIAIWG